MANLEDSLVGLKRDTAYRLQIDLGNNVPVDLNVIRLKVLIVKVLK